MLPSVGEGLDTVHQEHFPTDRQNLRSLFRQMMERYEPFSTLKLDLKHWESLDEI